MCSSLFSWVDAITAGKFAGAHSCVYGAGTERGSERRRVSRFRSRARARGRRRPYPLCVIIVEPLARYVYNTRTDRGGFFSGTGSACGSPEDAGRYRRRIRFDVHGYLLRTWTLVSTPVKYYNANKTSGGGKDDIVIIPARFFSYLLPHTVEPGPGCRRCSSKRCVRSDTGSFGTIILHLIFAYFKILPAFVFVYSHLHPTTVQHPTLIQSNP